MSAHFKYTLFILLLAFFAFSLGLYLAGIGAFSPFGTTVVMEKTNGITQTVVQKGSYETGYNEALDFARKRLTEEGIFEFSSSITATVKSVSGQNVIIEFDATDLDMFAEGMDTKTVVIGSNTVIEQRVSKPEEQLAKEYEEYEKAREEFEVAYAANPDAEGLVEPDEPPDYTIKNLVAGDLKPGDRVHVLVKTEETEEVGLMTSPFASDSFEATEIRLLSRPTPEPEEALEEESPEELAPEEAAEPEEEALGDVVAP